MLHLETPRMPLRQFNADDDVNLFSLNSDPQVVLFTGSAGQMPSLTVIQQETLPRYMAAYSRSSQYGLWAAIEKQTQDFIGWFMFRPFSEASYCDPSYPFVEDIELGYRLKRSAWGRGLASEGVQAILQARTEDAQIAPVMAVVLIQNVASIRVLEKSGFTLFQVGAVAPSGEVVNVYRLENQRKQ